MRRDAPTFAFNDTLSDTTLRNASYSYDSGDNKTAEAITGGMSGDGFSAPSCVPYGPRTA